eukprot:6491497-Amphidinium_carterae.2
MSTSSDRITELQNDVEHLEEDLKCQRKQTLLALHLTVARSRKEASCQIVWKNFGTETDLEKACRERDEMLNTLVEAFARGKRVGAYSHSHQTATDRVSPITVTTFEHSWACQDFLRWLARQPRMPTPASPARGPHAEIQWKRQTCLWDRLCSAPPKAMMSAITESRTRANKEPLKFDKPDWKKGIATIKGSLAISWDTDLEHATLRLYVHPEFYHEALPLYHQYLDELVHPQLRRKRQQDRQDRQTSRLDMLQRTSAHAFKSQDDDELRVSMNEAQVHVFPWDVIVRPLHEKGNHHGSHTAARPDAPAPMDISGAKPKSPSPKRGQEDTAFTDPEKRHKTEIGESEPWRPSMGVTSLATVVATDVVPTPTDEAPRSTASFYHRGPSRGKR